MAGKNLNTKTGRSPEQQDELLRKLESRFEKHMNRHDGLLWADIREKLVTNPQKLRSLWDMERTGGEPDVVGYDEEADEILFFDCAKESPKDRRSVCYDQEALESRKKYRPENNAVDMAESMGIDLLTEAQYLELQTLGNFDTKTSSWIKTPAEMRKQGGAQFGDFRYGRTFIFHNGAESYFATRGFRGSLRV